MASSRTPKKRQALGRGLSSLLKDNNNFNESSEEELQEVEQAVIAKEIPLEQIEANKFQPRTEFEDKALKELSDSIATHGIITPITVRKLSEKEYELISGERRLRASKMAGLEVIPAYIRQAKNDQEMLEWAIIENVQREDLNALEIALGYQRLISECNITIEELGKRVGKDRSTVNNYTRLLTLPDDIQHALKNKVISMGHARTLIALESIDLQISVFNEIVSKGLSVRKTEELVKSIADKKKTTAPAKRVNVNGKLMEAYDSQEKKLVDYFGSNVKVQTTDGKKGEIKITFNSVDDFNRIIELIDLE